jgi:hypothetical protein
MMTNEPVYAGVDFTSGRHPVMLAVLDDTLNVFLLEKYDIAQAVARLKEYDEVSLAVNVPSTTRLLEIYSGFKKQVGQAGFESYSTKNVQKQLIETNAQEYFRALIRKSLLPRRTLEGRVQRGLILFEQGLRITDPMDFFEELTSYHILDGVFPNELLNSSSELDALASAHVAWLVVNEPGRTRIMENRLVVPKEPERD